MTNIRHQALLEDYIDNELTGQRKLEFDRLLESDPEFRSEVGRALRLKECFKHIHRYTPDESYFSEVGDLILARTVHAEPESIETVVLSERSETSRQTFVRSLVSFAASVVILFGALLLGNSQPDQIAAAGSSMGPVYVLDAADERVDSDNSSIVSRAERLNLSKGMLLMGAPGGLGRFNALIELPLSIN